ncbi:MAG: carbohydrate kinase family protein [Candidatus Taylorbacteria bacterium]|nr:carbohydrate kinase family protein [Candidatus Taylorbacteria bacterium]
MNQKLDFLAIGDITIDAFIKLQDANVHCDVSKENCELCVRFADKIPYESVTVVHAVGNASNAAVSASRLGLQSGLVTNMGDDENGKECLEVLKNEKIDTHYVMIQKGIPTNYHYVLSYGAERTILIKHEPYEYKLPPIEPAPVWIYLSSFRGNDTYHTEIINYLETHPEVNVAFQPGKFEINLGYEKLKKLYTRSALFFCNKEEAQKILNVTETDFKKLLDGICALGPKVVCITDGPKGAYALDGNTKEYYFQPIYPDPMPPISRTGAGDAFSSTFTVAIALGKSFKEALMLAPINSMSVVQHIGAQKGLLPLEQLEKYLKEASKDYTPQQI